MKDERTDCRETAPDRCDWNAVHPNSSRRAQPADGQNQVWQCYALGGRRRSHRPWEAEGQQQGSSVCERLLFVAAVRKRFPTVVWIVYPRVHSSVDCQAVAVGKRLPTDVTSVWFIPRGHSTAVVCQMAGCS